MNARPTDKRAGPPEISTSEDRTMKTLNMKITTSLALRMGGVCLSMLAAAAHAEPAVIPFETHAAFFSSEMHMKDAIDPQVFVKDAAGKAGVGPQQITHEAGLRNPRVTDAPSMPIFNARGAALSMSLGEWLGPQGEAVLTPRDDGKETISVIQRSMSSGVMSRFTGNRRIRSCRADHSRRPSSSA